MNLPWRRKDTPPTPPPPLPPEELRYNQEKRNAEIVMRRADVWVKRSQRMGPSWESLLIGDWQ